MDDFYKVKLPSPSSLIMLVSEDGQNIPIEESSAQKIGIISEMLEMSQGNPITIPVPAVKSTILLKIIEFLAQHSGDDQSVLAMPPKSTQNRNISNTSDSEHSDANYSDSSDDSDYVYEEYLCTVSPWDQKFVDSLDISTLLEVMKAANYLDIPCSLICVVKVRQSR